MNHLRPRRPVEGNSNARINYVLRRYGGLEVYVPRYNPLGTLATHPNLHHFSNYCDRGVPGLVPAAAARSQPTHVWNPNEPNDGSSSSDSSDFHRWTGVINPFGNFTPLFGGRIVLGPGKVTFFLCLVFFAAVFGQIFLEKDLILAFSGGLPIFILGNVLAAFCLCAFFMVGITDPGIVPKNYTIQELMTETEDFRTRHPADRFYRYCNKCKVCRPPRTFHCSRCEICIRQQDVHFFVAGKCIGERNRRCYFFTVVFQTLLGVFLLATSFIIVPHLEKESDTFVIDTLQTVGGTLSGLTLLFFPQSGLFMFVYRFYLIGVGRTAREEYRKYQSCNREDCVEEQYPLWTNIKVFFFRRSMPSAFRASRNRVLDIENLLCDIPTPWVLEQEVRGGRLAHSSALLRDSRDLIRAHGEYEELEEDEDDLLNANRIGTGNNRQETTRLREVAAYARGKSTPSVPLFEQGLNPLMTRIKMSRKSKPSCILQQKISAFHTASKLPKATVSYHKRQSLPCSLSEGCIPRTKDGTQEMIQLSRATQLRRIIQMILLRDRDGLIEMSNRVNIAALVGMNRFDPDNLQLLELNNGLPMIAPRRREPEVGNHRLGAGVLGIPQMVAAGLLPTARDIASSVESMVGSGRIRRLPPVGRQRYTPITVVGPPLVGASSSSRSRRPLHIDEIDRIPMHQNPSALLHNSTAPPPIRATTVPQSPVAGLISSSILPIGLSRSSTPPAPPPTQLISPVTPDMMDNANNNAPIENIVSQ